MRRVEGAPPDQPRPQCASRRPTTSRTRADVARRRGLGIGRRQCPADRRGADEIDDDRVALSPPLCAPRSTGRVTESAGTYTTLWAAVATPTAAPGTSAQAGGGGGGGGGTVGADEHVPRQLEARGGARQVRGGLPRRQSPRMDAEQQRPNPERQAGACACRRRPHGGGRQRRAQSRLDLSAPYLTDPVMRAQAARMEGAIRFATAAAAAPVAAVSAAQASKTRSDAHLAREARMETFEAAMWAWNMTTGTHDARVVTRARGVEDDESFPQPVRAATPRAS